MGMVEKNEQDLDENQAADEKVSMGIKYGGDNYTHTSDRCFRRNVPEDRRFASFAAPMEKRNANRQQHCILHGCL